MPGWKIVNGQAFIEGEPRAVYVLAGDPPPDPRSHPFKPCNLDPPCDDLCHGAGFNCYAPRKEHESDA